MKIHIVKKGDTMYGIAQKYGVELDKLIAFNKQIADPDNIDVGMKIKIPTTPVPVAPPVSEIVHKHTVVQGDTLWKLSKAWGVPLTAMIKANPHLKNPNILMTGDVVYVPKLAADGQPILGAGKKVSTAPIEEAKQMMVQEEQKELPPQMPVVEEAAVMPQMPQMTVMEEKPHAMPKVPEMVEMPTFPKWEELPHGMPMVSEMAEIPQHHLPKLEELHHLMPQMPEWAEPHLMPQQPVKPHATQEAVEPFAQVPVPAVEAFTPTYAWCYESYAHIHPAAGLTPQHGAEELKGKQFPAGIQHMPSTSDGNPHVPPMGQLPAAVPGYPQPSVMPHPYMDFYPGLFGEAAAYPQKQAALSKAAPYPAFTTPCHPCQPYHPMAAGAAGFPCGYPVLAEAMPYAFPGFFTPHADFVKTSKSCGCKKREGRVEARPEKENSRSTVSVSEPSGKPEKNTRGENVSLSTKSGTSKKRTDNRRTPKRQNTPWIRQ